AKVKEKRCATRAAVKCKQHRTILAAFDRVGEVTNVRRDFPLAVLRGKRSEFHRIAQLLLADGDLPLKSYRRPELHLCRRLRGRLHHKRKKRCQRLSEISHGCKGNAHTPAQPYILPHTYIMPRNSDRS